MDFDKAARRLEKEQSNLRDRRGRGQPVSIKAKREADYRRKQQERLRKERERKQRQLQRAKQYITSCDRMLGIKSLGQGDDELKLKATSIHGDGDKIALPPSVLESLTEKGIFNDGSSPWMFRVGILDTSYSFPSSVAIKNLSPPDDAAMMDDDDDDEMGTEDEKLAAYLEELSDKYISYSHGTVVEFTQEEGHVGLPASIAAALLDTRRLRQDGSRTVPATRTKDPAGSENDDSMDIDNEKTPGHLAWGAFDVPDVPIEIVLLTLPKGKNCQLVPTMSAIKNGFHRLKDIKLVLEQSLIRTRATLSIGDTVSTWHRGVKFDLSVASVTPSDFNAVSCINTDIEVDIGANKEYEEKMKKEAPPPAENQTPTALVGRTLASASSPEPKSEGVRLGQSSDHPLPKPTSKQDMPNQAELLPEPPQDQKEGVCTVQIRADGSMGRRRFDTNAATLQDLFAFASTVCKMGTGEFRLVTRSPRRVLEAGNGLLSDAGISSGRELFLVERL